MIGGLCFIPLSPFLCFPSLFFRVKQIASPAYAARVPLWLASLKPDLMRRFLAQDLVGQ